jgi:hypothetical protein
VSLLLALAAAAAAHGAAPPLTLREAQALSPEDLAARVLGLAGSLYGRGARLWDGHSNFGDTGHATIEFAGGPRSSGNPGLCIADTMFVSFSLVGDRRAGPDRRMQPDGEEALVTGHAYRIIGDTNDRRERSDREARAQNAECARAGPVIGDWASKRFFTGPRLGLPEAVLAARALQIAIAEARRGPVSRLTCTAPDPTLAPPRACTDPRSDLAALSPDRLRYASVDRCSENPAHLCADLAFESGVPVRGNVTTTLRVTIGIDVARADPPPDSFHVLAVAMGYESGIND